MAKELFKKPVNARKTELNAEEKAYLSDARLLWLYTESRKQFISDLGIDLGEGFNIPKTSTVPRMLVMKRTADNHDKLMSFEEAGIRPGSRDFWEQAAMGNVFVYPAGQKGPSQLQMNIELGSAHIGYSEPITERNYPDPPLKPLSFWEKIKSFFIGKYKKQNAAWNNRSKDKADNLLKMNGQGEIRRPFFEREETEGEAVRERYAKAQRQAEYEKDYRNAEKDANARDMCAERMTNIFRPDPIMDKELLTVGNDTRLYKKEQFDSLTRFPKDGPDGFDLDKIEIGKSGEKMTAEDFTAVTMFALWGDDICDKAAGIEFEDTNAMRSLTGHGFKEEQVTEIFRRHVRSFYTGDLFITKARENEGNWFEPITNEGRKAAAEAFKDYQKGDKNKMAAIISDGINKCAKEAASLEGKISQQDIAWVHNSEKLIGLMEKDPELKALAMQKGMTEENLKVVSGINKIGRMIEEGHKAKMQLAKARAEGLDMSGEEKKDIAKAVVKAKLAQVQLGAENLASGPDMTDARNDVMTHIKNPQGGQTLKDDPGLASDGKPYVWADTVTTFLGGLDPVSRPVPKYPASMTNERSLQMLDKQAEYICSKHNVGEQSMDWLF
ncbi:MAG: hypothetical protein K6G83_13315, partial [Lachnospiraceae bacterium]|nr:hypothetical protein [Lachnospiraceae bacterium]